MERYCGTLGSIALKGRRYPNAAIANRMHQQALINLLNNRHTLELDYIFMPSRRKEYAEEDEDDDYRIPGSTMLDSCDTLMN
jgi:hypothetical protein